MKKFLVIDDESLNCRLLREILAKIAYCDCVYNGPDALTLFSTAHSANVPYDLVLLDISMPEMDGIEVLEKMRSYEENAGVMLGCGTPILMVTAVKEHFMTAFKKGADDYVLKPVDQDVLLQKIDSLLAKNRTNNS
ncbi:MAG: Response regulator receiver protein [uncultured bacterium]|nr:MAG: Response regulator receiver protein [uncultured bacterium]